MSDNLTDFLLARIADDEAVARAAITDDGGSHEGLAGQFDYLTDGRMLPRFGDDLARLVTRFAVPARVLAECEAKRRIVELDTPLVVERRDEGDGTFEEYNTYPYDHFHEHILRLLALPYADREGYRQEWRP